MSPTQQPSPSNYNHHSAACTQDATHLAQARNIIIEMLDHIKSRHQIERAIIIGQIFGDGLLDWRHTPRATKLDRVIGYVDTFHRAELRKHFQVAAGAATDIKNARWAFIIARQLGSDSPDKRGN